MDATTGEWRRTMLGWVWVEATACVGLAGVDRAWERDAEALLARGRAMREATTPTLRGVR